MTYEDLKRERELLLEAIEKDLEILEFLPVTSNTTLARIVTNHRINMMVELVHLLDKMLIEERQKLLTKIHEN